MKYEHNQKSLRMMLEDSTLEEAMWALGQTTGLCHLSLRPRQAGTSSKTLDTLKKKEGQVPGQSSTLRKPLASVVRSFPLTGRNLQQNQTQCRRSPAATDEERRGDGEREKGGRERREGEDGEKT